MLRALAILTAIIQFTFAFHALRAGRNRASLAQGWVKLARKERESVAA